MKVLVEATALDVVAMSAASRPAIMSSLVMLAAVVSQLEPTHVPAPPVLARLVVNATMEVFPALRAAGMGALDTRTLFDAPLRRCALRGPAVSAAAAIEATGMSSVLEVAAVHWWCAGLDAHAPARELVLWLLRQWGQAQHAADGAAVSGVNELGSRLLMLSGDTRMVDAVVQVRG